MSDLSHKQTILVVDDNPNNLKLLRGILGSDYQIVTAENGADAIEICTNKHIDLILLDIMMPDLDGYEVCQYLKEFEQTKDIPIIFISAKGSLEDEKRGLKLGAIDYITKPISPAIVAARVRNHMDLHLHQEHLGELVREKTKELRLGYRDTIQRLTLASEYKDEETGAHIRRISYYTKEFAARLGMDSDFCDNIFYASPMHDIGKVAIPDRILLKEGPLDEAEWLVMRTHTTIGAKILEGSASPYLRMAVDIARCHHERWDGGGYPHGLRGEEIPLTARIMNIADQYDALRSKRPYKEAFDQEKTVEIITNGDGRTMPEHFDPQMLATFVKCQDIFADIFATHKNPETAQKLPE